MTDSPPTAPRRARRALALAAAVATAAALGATALTLPAQARGTEDAPGIGLKDGTLEWGVKQGFRSYVTGPIAKGGIQVADGARQAPDNGPFTFTDGTGTYDTATHAVDTTFKGSVRFTGHAGALDLKFSDLKVTTEGTKGSIVADVTSSGTTSDDVALASLDLSGVTPGTGEGGAMTYADIPATLTADGARAFNDMYQEGQALDPATLSVTPDGQSTPPGGEPTDRPTRTPAATPGATPGGEPADTPSDSATDRPAAPGGIVDGALDWGVKKSFRDYVTGPVAKGKIDLGGGAEKNSAGFRFPGGHGSYDPDGGGSLDAAFAGTVRFTGHDGALDLKFSDLKVKADGTKGSLVADVSAKDRESGEVTVSDDLAVASLKPKAGSLTPRDGVVSLTDVPATLTEDGATAFGGFYEKGEALDPVTVAVTLDDDATLPDGPGSGGTGSGGTDDGSGAGTTGGSGGVTGGTGSLASTGTGLPAGPLMGASGALMAAGAAAAFAARRRLRPAVPGRS